MLVLFVVLINATCASPVNKDNVQKALCVEYVCQSKYKTCIGYSQTSDLARFQQESMSCRQAKCLCKREKCQVKELDNCMFEG